MVFLHAVVLWQEWWAVPIGFPDFSIFYTAGKIVVEGRGAQLYDDDLQESVQRSFAPVAVERRGSILPYNHPPFEAVLFAPFTRLPYLTAYFVWFGVNLIIIMILVWPLRRHLSSFQQVPLWLGFLAALAFTPIFIALTQGQDSILLLLCYTMAFIALGRNSDFLAGSWLGLGLCKYHLLLPFMVGFVLQKRMRLIAGFLTVALLLGVVAFAAVGWNGMLTYPQFVWHSETTEKFHWNSEHRNVPNLRGFLLTVLPGGDTSWGRVLVGAISALLLGCASYVWFRTSGAPPGYDHLAFAANVLMTVLISYHAYVQDLSLLFLVLLLVLDFALSGPPMAATIRKMLLVCVGILCCSPVYLVLILRFGHLHLLTIVLLAFFVALLSACAWLRAANRSAVVPAGTAAL
jgi:hypothetical protein